MVKRGVNIEFVRLCEKFIRIIWNNLADILIWMKIRLLLVLVIIVVCVGVFSAYIRDGIGSLVIRIRDPQVGWGPATGVYVSLSNILIHRADAGNESGWFDTGVSATNLSLGEVTMFSRIIGATELQAGSYNLIRLSLTQAVITVDGMNYTCRIPSEKLNVQITGGGVRINANQMSHLEIDITPRITGKDGDFKLTPSAKATPL